MVADPVTDLVGEIEPRQRNVGAPRGMVEPARDERVESVLTCMPKWAVPAVVA